MPVQVRAKPAQQQPMSQELPVTPNRADFEQQLGWERRGPDRGLSTRAHNRALRGWNLIELVLVASPSDLHCSFAAILEHRSCWPCQCAQCGGRSRSHRTRPGLHWQQAQKPLARNTRDKQTSTAAPTKHVSCVGSIMKKEVRRPNHHLSLKYATVQKKVRSRQ